MAKLSEDEERQLAALLERQKAPERESPNGRTSHVDIYVDLSDEAAVDRAIGFGLLTRADLERAAGELGDEDEGEEGEEGEDGKPRRPRQRSSSSRTPDDTPRRRGYFKE